MWRHVHPARSFLHLFFIASLCCVVYAQSGTDGRGGTCSRYWWTTMWGFIVTLIALTLDILGIMKVDGGSILQGVILTLLSSALNPLYLVWIMLDQTLKGMAMRGNLREALGDDMVAPLWPWSKSPIKIIMGSEVVVNLSPDVYEEVHNSNAFEDRRVEIDVSEALVVGIEVRDSSQFNVVLSDRGALALLRSNVLPPYDQLKFLRGNTTLAMTIAATQAIGYISGVVIRCGQGLQVSPIEAIACGLNIVVLMKVVLHNFASIGHRPLLLYLLLEQEVRFIEECRNVESYQFETKKRLRVGISMKCIILLVVGAYFIYNFVKASNRLCLAPIILFYMNLVLGGILGFIPSHTISIWPLFLAIIIVMLNVMGYIWALIVTFKFWKVEEFDVRSSNYFSQVLPYIG